MLSMAAFVVLGASPMAAAAVVDLTLVAHYQVANIDGSFLRLPLFNGTFPGPPIECLKGDTLRINVINDMKKEELSVNWQGMVQRNTNHMDGVPYVTEIPIASGGGNRVYEFEADAAGTFHYHSNQEFIRSGLHGIIIVKEPDAASDPLVDEYGDYSELVAVQHSTASSPIYPALVATDLYHKGGTTLAQQLDNGIGDWIWAPQSIVVNGHGLYDCTVNYDTPYYFRCTWQCPAEDLECIDEVRCSYATHPFNGRVLGPYVWEEQGSNALYDALVASDPGRYTEEVQAAWADKCGLDHLLPFLYGTPNEQVVDGRPVGATGVHQNQFLNWGRPTGLRCDLPDPVDRDPRCLVDGTWPFKGLNRDRVYDHLRNEDGTYDVGHFDEADLDEHGALCRPTRFYTGDAQPEGNHNPFGMWAQSPLRCDTYPQSLKKAESPAVFEVEAGKTYRLRLVNVASLIYSTLVIEGHSMIVVQVDGAYVEPMETTFLDLWNGQTYSVMLRADAEVQGDFWIGLAPRHRGYTRIDPGRAILRYITKDPVTGESTPVVNEDARLPGDKSRPVPKYWDAAPKGNYPDINLGQKPIACPVDLHSTIYDNDRDFGQCPGFYPDVFDQDVSMEQQYRFKSPEGKYPLPALTRPNEAPVMVVQNMNANGYRDVNTYAVCASDYGNSEVQGTYVNAYSYVPFYDPIWDPLHSIFRPGTDVAGQQGDLCGVHRWSINNISYPFRYVETIATQEVGVGGKRTYKQTLLEHAYDRTLDKLDYVVDVRRPDETPYFSTSPDGYFSSIDPNVLGGRTKLDQGIPPASNELYNIQRFKLGDVFDVVMQNTVYLRFWTNALYGDKHDHRSGSNQHPFHSHGFNFWTLGYGEGNFDLEAWNKETAVNSESGPRNYAGGIIWQKNIANPPFRNLAVNFAGGWTVLRIKADNPGLWWFHCTTMAHFHMGMGTTFGFGLDRLPKPSPFLFDKKCAKGNGKQASKIFNLRRDD